MINTFNNYKPIKLDGNINSLIDWLKAINWMYYIQRLPIFLLSTPAAYGTYAFSNEHLPQVFAVIAGIAFEATYIGAISISDQLYDTTKTKKIFWYLLNFTAVFVSALINVLFASGNSFAGITLEALVHGMPFPILSLFYAMFLHSVSNDNIVREFKKQQHQEQLRMEHERFESENPYLCDVCSERKPTRKALSNHMRAHKPKA